MTDNAQARNEATDTTVLMQQVANGSFTAVSVRQGGKSIYSHTWISHEHLKAQMMYETMCKRYEAK